MTDRERGARTPAGGYLALRDGLCLGLRIAQELDIVAVLDAGAEETRRIFEAPWAAAILWNDGLDDVGIVRAAGVDPPGSGVLRRLGRQLIHQRASGGQEFAPHQGFSLIVADEETLGVLVVGRPAPRSGTDDSLAGEGQANAGGPGDPTAFSPGDEPQGLLDDLGYMLGIAVRNAGVVTRLKELNEFRDAMLQMAAHDLRAPLSHVVAYLELIREDEAAPAEQRQQWYAVTGQALERMAHLINGILDYTRAGHEDHLKRQQVDLTAIGREAIDDLEEAAAAKSQKIELRASPADTWVQGDASLLREAVRNLVANAVAYSPPGTTITVSTSRTRGNVRLAVADGGPGIPEEELPALFQPFRRLSTSAGTEGTGLGLSLVKRIVEQHGGRVEVESVVGEGSTFEIVLAHAPAKDVAPAGLSRSSSQSPRA